MANLRIRRGISWRRASHIKEQGRYKQAQEKSLSQSQIPQATETINENNTKEDTKRDCKDLTRYLPLYGAALEGNWESAQKFFADDSNAMTAAITDSSETILHIAVKGGHATRFVSELVKKMGEKELEKTDDFGCTALFYAAIVGNTKVAKILVKRHSRLPQVWGSNGYPPLNSAATYGHKDTVLYLLSETKDKHPASFTEQADITLIKDLITGGLNGIPKEEDNLSANPTAGGRDEENPNCSERFIHCGFLQWISSTCGKFCQKVQVMLWNRIKQLVPMVNHIHDKKLMHVKTLELVELLCAEVLTSSYESASKILQMPLFTATRLGIHEFVKEIIKTCPPLAFSTDSDKHSIFQLAVIHRQDKVFNLICHMGLHKRSTTIVDKNGNNTLHLVGQLQPSRQVSGAALQMQRELQWFKVVENLIHPSFQEAKNADLETPREVFTKNHKLLVKEGEAWMKNIASSCSVVATLIAAMMFAAAFTLPGGNNDQGMPIFSNELSFLVFALSDGLALFSSSISVLLFLGILTSRYSEEDFLESLPKKLIIARHLIHFYSSHDGNLWCNPLYSSWSSIELGSYSNCLIGQSRSDLIWMDFVSSPA